MGKFVQRLLVLVRLRKLITAMCVNGYNISYSFLDAFLGILQRRCSETWILTATIVTPLWYN
jgi:hypothetical protein